MSPKRAIKTNHHMEDGQASSFLSPCLFSARWWCICVCKSGSPPSHFTHPFSVLSNQRLQQLDDACPPSSSLLLLPVPLWPPQLRLRLPSFLVLYPQVIGQARNDRGRVSKRKASSSSSFGSSSIKEEQQKHFTSTHTRPQPAPLQRAPGS